jgi:hypothetical protein
METKKAKWKAFALIRDKDGKPKIDDKNNIPEQIWNMLTETEKQEIKEWRTM